MRTNTINHITIVSIFYLSIFNYSCTQTKKAVVEPAIKINSFASKGVDTSTKQIIKIYIPKSKSWLYNSQRVNISRALRNITDLPIPDRYGYRFKNYQTSPFYDTESGVPIYDINNLPISVWFLTKNDKYVGFIVAGHAEKAVCEIASLEIFTKIQEIGDIESSIFTFGVGHHILTKKDENEAYHNLMKSMKDKFEALELEHYEQVRVNEIQYDEYLKYLFMIKNHVNLANQSQSWDTHIVEYKLNDFPIIVPFYYTKTSERIEFKIPKSKFNEIPADLVFASYRKNFDDNRDELQKIIEENNNTLSLINTRKVTRKEYSWRIKYYSFSYNKIKVETKIDILKGYDPPPDSLYLYDTDPLTGKEINKKDIELEEAVILLNDPKIKFVSPYLRRRLEIWRDNSFEYIKGFDNRKELLKNKIIASTKEFSQRLNEINSIKEKMKIRNNEDFIVDALLRGWLFEVNDKRLNQKLNDWYLNNREKVWSYILDSVPNSRIDDRLGGIFNSDDVFFQVQSKGDNFIITPYKVLGGEFIQIIDKKIGISYLQSSFSYRYSNNYKK